MISGVPSAGRVAKGIKNPRMAMRYLRQNYPITKWLGIQASSRGFLGTHVLSKEWDVLILLDTCRVDALRMVSDEYSFLNDVGRLCSVGGSSPEWMAATFNKSWRSELQDTAYLCGNGFAEFIFEQESWAERRAWAPPPGWHFFDGRWDLIEKTGLGRLEHLHRYTSDEEERVAGEHIASTPPQYITDRAVAVNRDFDFDRLMLHYIQPHHRYTASAIREEREFYKYETEPWEYLRQGGDREVVFEAYLDELRYVLDSIELLLKNIDAETVVISADHGEAFGEYGAYGHGPGSIHPHVRFVPWATTTADDSGSYTPDFAPEDVTEQNVDETLRALGYIE